MSKVVNRSVCWRPSERGPSCTALLISTPHDRDGRFLLGPMLRTLSSWWGIRSFGAPKTGCNRPDQGRPTGDKKPIFSPVEGVDLCRTFHQLQYAFWWRAANPLKRIWVRSSNLLEQAST
jgi:hypothetical protein